MKAHKTTRRSEVQAPPALHPLLELLISVLIAAGIGAAAGYFSALKTPVPPQIAVINMEALIKDAAERHPSDPNAAAADLAARIKAVTEPLNADGIVVINSSAVIAAPPEVVIDVP